MQQTNYNQVFEGLKPGTPIIMYSDRGNGKIPHPCVFMGFDGEQPMVAQYNFLTKNPNDARLMNLKEMGKIELAEPLPKSKCKQLPADIVSKIIDSSKKP